jgi:hypothetical protein
MKANGLKVPNSKLQTLLKLQTPNSKLQRSSKYQTPKPRPIGTHWSLKLGVSLVFEAWNLEFHAAVG